MKRNTAEIIIVLVVAIPFIAAALCWKQLPNQMAVHFNLKGQADGYGGKPIGLLLLPAVNVAIYLLLKFLPKIIPAGDQFALLEKRFTIIRLTVHGFVTLLYLAILLHTLHYAVNLLLLIMYGVLLVSLVTGNYLNNIRPNHFIGVRTPWTMKNPEVWRRTHHLASRMMVVGSLAVMCIIPFLSELVMISFTLGYMLVVSFVPVVYSWMIYSKTESFKK